MPCQAEAMNQIFEIKSMKDGGLQCPFRSLTTESLIKKQNSIYSQPSLNRQRSFIKREKRRKSHLRDVEVLSQCSGCSQLDESPPLQKYRQLRIATLNRDNAAAVEGLMQQHQPHLNFVVRRTYEDLKQISNLLNEGAESEREFDDDCDDDEEDDEVDFESDSDDDDESVSSTVSSLTTCSFSM